MQHPTKAIIFLNGDLSDSLPVIKYIKKDTLLIGCDGGTNHILALGYEPHVVIGDFDSFILPPASERNGKNTTTEYIQYPTDKDFTDSELALNYVRKLGCTDIILTGALGSRTDHFLGNIFLLTKRKFANIKITIVDGRQEIYLIRTNTTIQGRPGDTISFMPISGRVHVESTTGLTYDLSQYRLSMQGNQGISNILTRSRATIQMKSGVLLVVHQIKKEGV